MTEPQEAAARPPRRAPSDAALAPFLAGVLFFLVLTPLGLVLRLARRDPLRLRLDRAAPSYWVPRAAGAGRQTSMKQQS